MNSLGRLSNRETVTAVKIIGKTVRAEILSVSVVVESIIGKTAATV
jgi:hypothetical protein